MKNKEGSEGTEVKPKRSDLEEQEKKKDEEEKTEVDKAQEKDIWKEAVEVLERLKRACEH